MAREYILSVAAAAMILCVLSSFSDPKSGIGLLCRMLGGLYLCLVMIRPISGIDLRGLNQYWNDYASEASAATAHGAQIAGETVRAIIKQETEAYILDKAGLLGAALTASVTVSASDPPVPDSVVIQGDWTAEIRLLMEQMLKEELNIPKENQTWIGPH